MAALSGVCSVAYLHTAGPTGGTGYELTVLAATIIGGVQLTGGRGSIIGVLLGLVVIGIIQNLIVLWGISPSWTQGVSGIVLIAAVTVTWLTRREGGGARLTISRSVDGPAPRAPAGKLVSTREEDKWLIEKRNRDGPQDLRQGRWRSPDRRPRWDSPAASRRRQRRRGGLEGLGASPTTASRSRWR